MGTRIVTAVAALVSAYVHLKLWLDGFSDIDMIGPAFMFNALAWKHWAPGFLAAGFGASTLGAFILSATVGLFGLKEQWTGGYQLTAAVAEVVCIVGGLLVMREAWPRRQSDTPVGASTDGQTTSGSR